MDWVHLVWVRCLVTGVCEHGNEPAVSKRTGFFFIRLLTTSFVGMVWTPEDGGNTSLRSSGRHKSNDTASHLRRPGSSVKRQMCRERVRIAAIFVT